jgi:hypothetical protein
MLAPPEAEGCSPPLDCFSARYSRSASWVIHDRRFDGEQALEFRCRYEGFAVYEDNKGQCDVLCHGGE